MEDKVRTMLDEVIESEVRHIKTLSIGSDERTDAIEELCQFHKLRIEELKIKEDARSKEEDLKSKKHDRWVNMGLQIGLTVGGWAMFTLWQGREQKFELTGTPTSPIFRGLLSRMIPTMKK